MLFEIGICIGAVTTSILMWQFNRRLQIANEKLDKALVYLDTKYLYELDELEELLT